MVMYAYMVTLTLTSSLQVCVLRLTADRLFFIVTESGLNVKVGGSGNNSSNGSSATAVWCELDRGRMFREFNMEGVTADHPEIYLELEPDRLAKVGFAVDFVLQLKPHIIRNYSTIGQKDGSCSGKVRRNRKSIISAHYYVISLGPNLRLGSEGVGRTINESSL